MYLTPPAFPREFRQDVIRVFREFDSSVAQVAKDFGISASCLNRWISIDDRKSGPVALTGSVVQDSVELCEAKKRIVLLKQENEVLRRAAAYLSQANLSPKGSTRS